jgi:uncharacterized circularly permuted ATP-grasp superfamily protein
MSDRTLDDLAGLLSGYDPGAWYCELLGRDRRPLSREIARRLCGLDIASLRQRARDAERELYNLGITFTVYSDREAIDRVIRARMTLPLSCSTMRTSPARWRFALIG